MNTPLRSCIAAVAVLLAAHGAEAAPVQWTVESGGNGHHYELVPLPAGSTSWDLARQQAAARSFGGSGGHLATLTSAAENSFVAALLPTGTVQQWFIGGRQAPGAAAADAAWSWVTGEAWDYTNWSSPFQPDNHPFYPEGEDALSMYSGSTGKRGTWNDTSVSSTFVPSGWEQIGGMVVEYKLPEPGTMALVIASLALLGSRRSPAGAA